MASLVLSGDTSGSITVAAPAVAGSTTQTLVNVTGTLAPVVSGTAITLTNQTAPEFTDIPSWVKRITVMFYNVSTSSTGVPLIQLGTAGSYITSGYASTSTRLQDSTAVSVGVSTTGFNISSTAAATTLSGSVVITNISANLWVVQGSFSNTTTTNFVFTSAGRVDLAAALTRVRLFIDGTQFFDGGTFNILYE